MFRAAVFLLMFVLPIGSAAIELERHGFPHLYLAVIGKWFVFWGIGVRLCTAGIRQVLKPGLTSEGILKIKGERVWILVRELGAANAGIGTTAMVSLWQPAWRPSTALAGGLFLGLAGLLHLRNRSRDPDEDLAMYSDFFVAIVALTFLFGAA